MTLRFKIAPLAFAAPILLFACGNPEPEVATSRPAAKAAGNEAGAPAANEAPPAAAPAGSNDTSAPAHADPPAPPVDGTVLTFPADRSLGTLQTYDFARGVWVELGEAQGEVTVPADASLILNATREAAEDLSPLASLPAGSIHTLVLDELTVATEQFEHVGRLTGLVKLSLRNAKIQDAAFDKLSGLKKLSELDISMATVGDEAMKGISALPAISTLDISMTEISSASFPLLEKMPNLSYLDPQRCAITNDELDALMELLPSCTVVTR